MNFCKFTLIKGKNKGKLCNKKNCGLHKLKTKNIEKPYISTVDNYEYYKYLLENNNINIQHTPVLLKYINNLAILDKNSSEYYKNKSFLDNYFSIPWNKYHNHSKDDIITLQLKLDLYIYKMDLVKNELINYMCKKFTNPNSSRNILALYGNPGVGKTKIIYTLSEILDYPIYTIPLGGMKDVSYLLGHNYTFVESNCGEIVKALKKTKIMNPIIYFDELDKVSNREIYSLLIFLTDPSQNNNFKDHYFSDITIDLSKIFFIFSFNDITKIDSVLLDRISLIYIDDYTYNDKKNILKNYILKNITNNINNHLHISFSDECYDYIINNNKMSLREYTFIMEKIIMEINKLILFEAIQSYSLIIELPEFINLFNKLNLKKNDDDAYLTMYI